MLSPGMLTFDLKLLVTSASLRVHLPLHSPRLYKNKAGGKPGKYRGNGQGKTCQKGTTEPRSGQGAGRDHGGICRQINLVTDTVRAKVLGPLYILYIPRYKKVSENGENFGETVGF